MPGRRIVPDDGAHAAGPQVENRGARHSLWNPSGSQLDDRSGEIRVLKCQTIRFIDGHRISANEQRVLGTRGSVEIGRRMRGHISLNYRHVRARAGGISNRSGRVIQALVVNRYFAAQRIFTAVGRLHDMSRGEGQTGRDKETGSGTRPGFDPHGAIDEKILKLHLFAIPAHWFTDSPIVGIGIVETTTGIPFGALVSMCRNSAGVLQHPCQVHQVPCHERCVPVRKVVFGPTRPGIQI